MRVLISGGGLGGLTLAHGLRTAGLHPRVFERGPAEVDVRASYRIHIDANGSRALHACLPADVWSEFERRSAAATRGIAFATEQLQHLSFIGEPDPAREPIAHAHPISRSGLRRLLLHGLDDVVTFDRRVVGYEQLPDGRVKVHFADGTSECGDVLVAADGSASPIRKQLLPHARVVDSGVAGIAGKVHLTDAVRNLVGPQLLTQMTMVLPVRGMAMFVAPFQRRAGESTSALDLPEHLFWVVIGPTTAFDVDFASRAQVPADLQASVLSKLERWHPLLRRLVLAADRATLAAVPLHTSQPVGPWPTGRVTLLGDAIHTMTPLLGLGGNTALMDAALLCEQLVEAHAGRTDLPSAIATYESAMRAYGFGAVQRSLQMSNSVASSNLFGRMAFRTLLRLADSLPPLHSMLFRRPVAHAPGGAAAGGVRPR